MNKAFLDTNLLIHLATSATEKAGIVSTLIAENKDILISVQVLNEFAAACFKKNLLPADEIQRYVLEFNLYFIVADVNFKTISEGFEIKKKYKYSWYDSLLLATALLNNCTIFYSEDMQHKQKIGNKLTIINPFK
jgi:predicted nucleic acid-binding protein